MVRLPRFAVADLSGKTRKRPVITAVGWRLVLLTCAATLAVTVVGSVSHAQDFTGVWQGMLHDASGDQRVVLKISSNQAKQLSGVLFRIDQGGEPIAVSPIIVRGESITMTVPGLGVTYAARVTAGAMTGTWRAASVQTNLVLAVPTPDSAWAIPDAPVRRAAVANDADVAFEVATIKVSPDPNKGKTFRARGRTYATTNTSLKDLLVDSLNVHPAQIVGGPAWLEQTKYDVLAETAAAGQPTQKQWNAMMQKLIAERFKLTYHREQRELSAYELVRLDSGPTLVESFGTPSGLSSVRLVGLGVLIARNATMTDLSLILQSDVLDRPVVDHAKLAGSFDFTLTWTPDEFQFSSLGIKVPHPSDDSNAPPSLFTAVREQLGLKLETGREPVDVVVIDHVEHPTED